MNKPDVRILSIEPYSSINPIKYFPYTLVNVYTFEWQSIFGREVGDYVDLDEYNDLSLAYRQLVKEKDEGL